MERWFSSLVVDEKYAYWITEIGHHFMRMELHSNNIEYLHPQIKEKLDGVERSAVLCKYNSFIYYVIGRGEKILIYNLDNNEIEIVNISCQKMNLNMYTYAGVIGDKLVIVPTFYFEIVYFDIQTYEVKKISLFDEKDRTDGFCRYLSMNSYVEGNYLTTISSKTKESIIISIEQGYIVERRKLPDKIGVVINHIEYNDGIIMVNDENEIMYYDNVVCNEIISLNTVKEGFYQLHIVQNKLWILPAFDKYIYIYILDEGKMIKFELLPADYAYTAIDTMAKFYSKYTMNDITYFAMNSANYIFYINNKTAECDFIEAQWPSMNDDIGEMIYQGRSMIRETTDILETYIKYIARK